MRKTLLLLATIITLCLPAFADASISGTGDLSGTVIIRFDASNVSAQILADVTIDGTLSIDGTDTAFTAKGKADGSGVGDMNTLAINAWLTFVADGALATGEPTALRGGIDLATEGISMSSDTAGTGTGTLYVAVTAFGETQYLSGTVAGSASGGFVPPDDPTTMQVTGTGTLTLVATTATTAEVSPSDQGSIDSTTAGKAGLPWKLDTWPEDMVQQLIETLGDE